MRKLLLASALVAVSGAAFAQDVVRMGTEGAYPPYNFINDAGEVAGFERDLGDELCKRAELTCTWVVNDWDSIIPNLQSGNYDTIIAGMSITEERSQVIDFTQEYVPATPSAYLASSMDVDLKGGVIAAQVSTIHAAYVAASGATLVEFATPDETIAAVRNGEVDAVFGDQPYLLPFAEESGGALVLAEKDIPLGGGVGMGVRKSDTVLKEKMDAAITSMKADGSLNELLVKWFGEDADLF